MVEGFDTSKEREGLEIPFTSLLRSNVDIVSCFRRFFRKKFITDVDHRLVSKLVTNHNQYD